MAVCTSTSEGFPNAVGEALACGVPCVVTDVGDAARLVGRPELVVPPGFPAALANAWARCLALNSQELADLRQEGRRRMVENFSVHNLVAETERTFQRLLSHH